MFDTFTLLLYCRLPKSCPSLAITFQKNGISFFRLSFNSSSQKNCLRTAESFVYRGSLIKEAFAPPNNSCHLNPSRVMIKTLFLLGESGFLLATEWLTVLQ